MICRVRIKNIDFRPAQWQMIDAVFNTPDAALKWVMTNTGYYFLEYRITDNTGYIIYEVVK